jgi:uncharacterized protein (TIGR02301 family)
MRARARIFVENRILVNRPVKGAWMFKGAKKHRSRALRVLAAAAFCVVICPDPGQAQFDFLFKNPLFGHGQEAKPPPATAKPPESPANTTKHTKTKPKKATVTKPLPDAKSSPLAPERAEPPPPYDPELLRLAEILGALTYLDELCAENPSGGWRAKMQALLDAEAKTASRKERLAGSYNRGFHDYERTYHACTQNAQLVISRFLAEGGKIAHEVVNRYGAS